MRALPERLATDWIKAKCDPDGKVEYKIEPLINRLTLDIGMRANKPEGIDRTGSVFDGVAFGLKGLRGLMYENGPVLAPFELEFEEVTIGRETVTCVTNRCLRAIPNILIVEISNAVAEISGITEKEADGIKNTSGSAEPNSTAGDATETNGNADTTACTEESSSESETT